MSATKTSTLTVRLEPCLKEALRSAAACEHRSIANMVEVLIRDYCGRNGIAIPENNERPDGKDNT
jgi:hypothetical protein